MQLNKTWNWDAPLVIAHRGASLHAPENTLSAFRLAVDLGADAIEFDVKLSRDNFVVIHHDMTLKRTTTGDGRVKDHSLEELKRLDAGVKFDPEFAGESIPTLLEVAEIFKNEILLNIELTNYNDPFDELPARVLKIMQESVNMDRVLISSFNPFALRAVRQMSMEARTALLLGPKLPNIIQRWLQHIAPHEDLHPHQGIVTKALIERVQRSNGRLNAWTVNEYRNMVELLEGGINGIITDDVEMALRARRDVYSV
ncbi:MAG: glycerophosphodiester phosphodiesterase family protein [bacterium]